MKLKNKLSPPFRTLLCLVFLMGIVSCNSDPCEVVPCHLKPVIELEPPEGTGSKTPESGEFTFYLKDKIDTYYENGIDMKLEFKSNYPHVGFVQIVRTVNLCDGRFIYPTPAKKERAIKDKGWYVDRGDGYKSAIFGQTNAGDFEPRASSGSASGSKFFAYIEDTPYRPAYYPNLGIRWQAVSMPVDLVTSAEDCNNEQLGYYYWSWTVPENGSLGDIVYGVANESFKNDVNNALLEWKNQHPDQFCIATTPALNITDSEVN